MSPEPQNVKECFHGSSQIVGKCHIICDFFWNISRWSAKTPKYQGSLNSPSLLTFKISLSDLQWILIVSRWVAKTPLVLGRFSRSSAKLQNFQINSTDYINALEIIRCEYKYLGQYGSNPRCARLLGFAFWNRTNNTNRKVLATNKKEQKKSFGGSAS